MGERRWRASQLAGLDHDARDRARAPTTSRCSLDALLENLHRAALNPLEEAAAYDQLLQDFDCTQEQLAARLGRSRSQVSNTIRLLKLPPAVQRRVAAGVLSAGHARALLAVEDPADAEHLAGRIVAEGLSVRAVEELVAVGDTEQPVVARCGQVGGPPRRWTTDRVALGDQWDTRVKVQLGQSKGAAIVVEFASMEDLERPCQPDVAGYRCWGLLGDGDGDVIGDAPRLPRLSTSPSTTSTSCRAAAEAASSGNSTRSRANARSKAGDPASRRRPGSRRRCSSGARAGSSSRWTE